MTSGIEVSNIYNQFLQAANPQIQTAEKQHASFNNIEKEPIASITLNQITKEEKSNAFTKTVAYVAIVSGTIGLILAKGVSGKFYKKLNSYLQALDDKIYEYTQKHKSLNTIQKGYLNFNKGLRKGLDWLKSGNNITAMKDSAFRWLCKKLHLTKPMNWVTSQFKKLTILTSKHSYENARNVADTNIAELRELISIFEKTDAKTAKQLQGLLNQLENQVSNITNATTRSKRLKSIEQATENIGDKVGAELWDIAKNRNKKNLEKLRLYRTEVYAAQGKEVLTNDLQDAQRAFTFNIEDKTRILKEARDELGQIIKANDKEARHILRTINKQIQQYSKLSGSNENAEREALVKTIQQNVEQLRKAINLNNYSPETQKLFNAQVNEIETILKSTEQKGTIEELLTLLNTSGFRTANSDAYNRAKVLTQEIRKATNQAFENELKLYDKFAEYNVGSAPTDVLGLILPMALGGYAISKGDNKDEKVSATLKAGIPILGGITTTFIATAKMMTNMQGLLIGGITGIVLNALGSKADEKYKEYKENNLFAQKAIAAYRRNAATEIS